MYGNFIPKKVAKVSSKVEKEAPEIVNWVDKLNQIIEDLSESKTRYVLCASLYLI